MKYDHEDGGVPIDSAVFVKIDGFADHQDSIYSQRIPSQNIDVD